MARRGRRRKLKLNVKQDTVQSAVSVVLLLSAGIILISFVAPNYSINQKVNSFVVGSFGWASIIFPLILLIGGLLQTQIVKAKLIDLRVFVSLIGLLLGFSGLFGLFGKGGGLGEFLANGLGDAISSVGAFLVFLAVIISATIFALDLTISEFAEKSGGLLSKIKDFRSGRRSSEESGNIEITSGEHSDGGIWEEEEQIELPEPAFEIVPSLSEPKSVGLSSDTEGVAAATIAPGLPYSDKIWENPPLDLLMDPSNEPVDRGNVKQREKVIIDTLASFGVDAEIVEVNYGPSVTQYALRASSGTRIARVSGLQHDLALALASPTGSVRIEAPIPGKSLIGIEVPNNTPAPVSFKEILISDSMKANKSKRAIVLGKDVGGVSVTYDIAKMPHLLVAGATGSGKSVFLHSLIFSLLYRCSPQECKFIFIDPKRVELIHYSGIPHLLSPVVTDIDKAASVFRWAVSEMERRYKLLETAKVRNIDAYNEKSGFQALPYIVIVVDELAEIMVADPAQVEKSIIRLAQLARATGIHLVLAVQRPSANIITGLIKANIPCRIAFYVTSQVDSRVIIDQPGAEKLLGKGDMLFVPPDASKPVRIQGSLVTDKEINQVVNYLKNQGIEPDYKEDMFEVKDQTRSVSAGGEAKDDLFSEAVEVVSTAGKASASLLQRRLSIGYARAARILDELEAEGVIGPAQGSKPRDILIKGSSNSPLSSISDAEEIEKDSFEDEFVS